MVKAVLDTLHGSLSAHPFRLGARGWLIVGVWALLLITTTEWYFVRSADRYPWQMDALVYYHAGEGDLDWAHRIDPILFPYGFLYSDLHVQAFKILPWLFTERIYVIVSTVVNALMFLFIMLKVSEIPYGTPIALVVLTKIFTWLWPVGNLSIAVAFLCLWPIGSVFGTLLKPVGWGVALAHAVRWSLGPRMGAIVHARQRAIHRLGVLCFLSWWIWNFWLSQATREMIW